MGKSNLGCSRNNIKYQAIIFKNKGHYCFKKYDYENSILNYKKALEIDPKYIDLWWHLGLVYFEIGNIEEANRCLDNMAFFKDKTQHRTLHKKFSKKR